MRGTADRGVLLGWLVAEVAALVLLHRMASAFPLPTSLQPDLVLTWAQTTTPLVAAASLLRVVAVGAAWYLLALTLIGSAGRLLGLGRAVHLADRLSPPALRAVLGRAVGAGLVAHLVLLSPTTAAAAPSSPATMRALPDQPPPTNTTTMRALPDQPPPTSTTTMRALPDEDPPTSTATVRPMPATEPAPAPPATWTVQPGEHLWHAAEVVLALHHGHEAPDAEVDAYVDEIVRNNLDVLIDPDDPDLVRPGQVLRLPSPSD
jgi:LysM repeat protein